MRPCRNAAAGKRCDQADVLVNIVRLRIDLQQAVVQKRKAVAFFQGIAEGMTVFYTAEKRQ